MAEFFKQYNYQGQTKGNTLFFLKCIFLKYLVNNQQLDFEHHQKELKRQFTFDHFLMLWTGQPIAESFFPETEAEPIGQVIWEWIADFVEAAPSFAGENPRIIGELYEESLLSPHKKNHGVFYTPANIADYMASEAVTKDQVEEELQNMRILDPACGSGSLLSAVYDRIFAEYGQGKNRMDRAALHQQLLQKNLLGVDRDPIACLVTRLVLVLKADTYVQPLGITCGDILTEELLAGDSVDVIIGNPPYVGHKEIDSAYMKTLKSRYSQVYQDKGDLSYCFINRGWELLKSGGILIHITSRYFLEAYNGKPLRRFIKNAFAIEEIVDFNGVRIIPGVGIDPAIIRLRKKAADGPSRSFDVKRFFIGTYRPEQYDSLICSLSEENAAGTLPYEAFVVQQEQLGDDLWCLYSPLTAGIAQKITQKSPFLLEHLVSSFQGVITGNDKAFIFADDDEKLQDFNDNQLKPWIKNRDVGNYTIATPRKKILYTNGIDAIETFPAVMAHLKAHREKLEKRRECRTGKLPWTALQWGREASYFDGKKIIFPYKATRNRFAIDQNQCYFSADVYGLILKPRLYHQLTEEILVVLLNSRLYDYYFKSYAKKLGDRLYEYYPNTLQKLRIPDLDAESARRLRGFYDKIMTINAHGNPDERREILATVDQWLYAYFDLTATEIQAIEKEG
jgi:adenine-specific DNA-methyltransferase